MSSTARPDALHDVILHVDKLINNLTFLMELLSHNTSKHWAAWANLKMSVVHFRVTNSATNLSVKSPFYQLWRNTKKVLRSIKTKTKKKLFESPFMVSFCLLNFKSRLHLSGGACLEFIASLLCCYFKETRSGPVRFIHLCSAQLHAPETRVNNTLVIPISIVFTLCVTYVCTEFKLFFFHTREPTTGADLSGFFHFMSSICENIQS